jgi:proteasome lid subunit RPN8/RPN11
MGGEVTLAIAMDLLDKIHAHGEAAYPEEGAGVLIGNNGRVEDILTLDNAREDGARHNRFLITPEDYLNAELTADRLGLSLIGVFHCVLCRQSVLLGWTCLHTS